MKKIVILVLAALLTMSLAACGAEETGKTTAGAPDKDTTAAPVDTTAAAPENTTPENTTAPTTPKADDEVFCFEAEGVKIIPGTLFDPTGLPEVEPYTVPSCAFDGSDVIYTYDAFEVTTNDLPDGQIVYSVYLLDPNVTTAEGLALGDDAARVTELYGEGEVIADQVTYQKGNTLLLIILQNDTVFSIEYRLAE